MPAALDDLFRRYSASVLNNVESVTSLRMCDTRRLESQQGYRSCDHLPLSRVPTGNSRLAFWPLTLESVFSPEIWAEYKEYILVWTDTCIDTKHFFFFKLYQNVFSPSHLEKWAAKYHPKRKKKNWFQKLCSSCKRKSSHYKCHESLYFTFVSERYFHQV